MNIEEKTIVFDFDETLAKVHFDKKILPYYDDSVDILTSKKNHSVKYSFRFNSKLDSYKPTSIFERNTTWIKKTLWAHNVHIQ